MLKFNYINAYYHYFNSFNLYISIYSIDSYMITKMYHSMNQVNELNTDKSSIKCWSFLTFYDDSTVYNNVMYSR